MLFAAFLSIFALDVFDESHGFWETALALLMHLLPSTILVIIVLIVSWRREWIAGVLFNALGVLYIILFWAKGPWYIYAAISGPLFLVGILFLLNWRFRSQLRTP
ncbi:MAG: hypothetical protein NT025_07595 [bacterium]|nr:hypothetical protein [bacterium]